MLRPTSRSDADRFLDLLESADFTESGFRSRPAMQQLPSRQAGNLPWLLEATAESNAFNVIARLFMIGVPLPAATVENVLTAPNLDFLVNSGMVSAAGQDVVPNVMLTPTEGFVIAADTVHRLQPVAQPDIILWPNQSTGVLQNFALREPCRSALDFGAGCGVVAVIASPFCERVVAADLNPRTAEFVAFNAWLNDIENIECVIGDSFEPVAGQTFDRILANPPFFVTPSSNVLYCENSFELDGFCRKLVREAPAFLNEGGFLQMTFEWVQIAGQPWQERLAEWVEGNGCDVWVLKTYNAGAAVYAHERCSKEFAEVPEAATEKYQRCVAYYHERKVQEIHGGVLAMRRRSGSNWMRFEEGRIIPGKTFEHLVQEVFATQDALSSNHEEARMMKLRPLLSQDASIEQQLRVTDGRWMSDSFRLSLGNNLPASLAIEPHIADFLLRCDGARTLEELVRDLAAAVKAPPDQVSKQCCAVVRKLAERRFLSFSTVAGQGAA